MKRKNSIVSVLVLVCVCLCFCLTSINFAQAQAPVAATVESQLKAGFPQLTFTSVKESDIAGIYEVVAGGNILYYVPSKNYIIFGEIWNQQGKSLTAERRESLFAGKIKDLDLSKAVKIGDGKNTVIVFTDPECPFCRKAEEWLKGQKDITEYVYFFPLPMHKNAEPLAKYILASPDKAAAFREVMDGKLDDKVLGNIVNDDVDKLLAAHKSFAQSMGVTGTPLLVVNGTRIVGADFPKIEKALK